MFKSMCIWGNRVAQLVKHLTFDLKVMSSSPVLGSMLGMVPTYQKKKKKSLYISPSLAEA